MSIWKRLIASYDTFLVFLKMECKEKRNCMTRLSIIVPAYNEQDTVKLFYKLINKVSDTYIVDGARDYRVMDRKMVDAILCMKEYNRFSKGIFSWVGFRQKYLEYENKDRVAGHTSWSFLSLLKYSIEGFIDFSRAPLLMVSVLGAFAFILAILGAILVFVRALIHPEVSDFGWSSLVVIMLALGGIQLLSLGIVGHYISNIYLESKKRPIYIARKVK